MAIIYVNKDTFQVTVMITDPGAGYLPTEETIAIKKYAELVRDQMNEFIEKKHEPMVTKLLEMCASYNNKNNPNLKPAVEAKIEAASKPTKSDKKKAPRTKAR